MTVTILKGDCREVLCTLPDESAHCVVTSPPYWGLRDYGIEPSVWGGDPACEHEWGQQISVNGTNHVDKRRWQHTRNGRDEEQPTHKRVGWLRSEVPQGSFCQHCNAWAGCLGLEPTPALFVQHIVGVFQEVRRVLRRDGIVWLNLGDCYASTPPGKPKDLCGIPWRVAFALQADGWYLRQDIIWSKPNPMPESVRDRCTKAHEYLFLLSKSERYYYDAEAIAEQSFTNDPSRPRGSMGANSLDSRGAAAQGIGKPPRETDRLTRNKRSVWEIATAPYSEAHFATFPPALIEPCIKAGTSEKGCCSACGAPWVREVEQVNGKSGKSWHNHANDLTRGQRGGASGYHGEDRAAYEAYQRHTTGWSSSCSCNAGTVPGTVLDPFGGAGTTGLVADRLGRNAVLIELNPEYAAMAERRIRGDAPLFAEVAT